MKFEHTKVWGFEHAIRGMRNPLESYHKIDSNHTYKIRENESVYKTFDIGPNDLDLMKRLIKGGPEHRKFMRQIFVSVDITACLAWWKEFDTYKVGTTANSTSTMHTISKNPITIDCFEIDNYSPNVCAGDLMTINSAVNEFLYVLEELRKNYLQTQDKRYWYELIRWLPEGWLQRRTVTLTYENIYNIISQRCNHKLNWWSGKDDPTLTNFISWTKTLPYANELFEYGSDINVFDNVIILLCGESGSGKTTIANRLAKKYKLNVLQSYTTRKPRYENEDGHTFVSNKEFDNLKDIVIWTEFAGNRYCATAEQIENNHIYVIDPDSALSLQENYKGNKKLVPIYIKTNSMIRSSRMLERGDTSEEIQNRIKNDSEKFKNSVNVCEVMFSNDNKLDTCVNNIYNYIISNY